MDLFIIGVVVLIAIAYIIFYYWSNIKPTESKKAPYKVETPVIYTMDETFSMPITLAPKEKSVQGPAKMAKPKLTKIEGGTAIKKPSAPSAPKAKTKAKTKAKAAPTTAKPKAGRKPKSTPKK